AADLCNALEQPPLGDSESLADAISRLEAHVSSRQEHLIGRQRRRLEALDQLRQLRQQEDELVLLGVAIERDVAMNKRLEAALEEAERRRQSAKSLARVATEARTAIVGKVFNSTLNKVWRDLF